MGRKRSTKAEIVKVAWKLFNEKGYEETTIDEIIAGSNASKGSFYHYFNSKDELLSSLSELFDVKYEEEMANLDPEMNSYDKLLYLCYCVHDMIQDEVPVGLLASLYASQVVTKGSKHLLDQNRYYYRMINILVEEGQRRGQIRNDMTYFEIARLYTLCERAIIYDYCISNGDYDLGDYTRQTMPLLFGCVKA